MNRFPFLFSLSLFGLLASAGCSDDNDDEASGGLATLEVQTAEDIPADTGGMSGPPGQGPPPVYTYYRLTDGRTVSPADSNSTQWDIALAGTTILVNGGTSGPGQGEAQVVSGAFDNLNEAPEDGYQTDGEAGLAIPTGSDNGWYNYTGQEGTPPNTIVPLPGRVIVLRTAEGNYAKLEVLSYYRGNPEITSDFVPGPEDGRHYTFRYVVQPNGSRTF